MVKKILIVGCGNIGSRHLQAISKLNENLEIHVVEPNKKAVLVAKNRLKEIKNSKKHIFTWYKQVHELNSCFDLSIVATNSDIRKNIIVDLLKMDNSKFLLEKIVCQSESDYKHLITNIKKHKAKAWVNLPMHYFPFFKNLKKKFKTSQSIYMSILTGNKGLGSTAIHYIDLFSWLCDRKNVHLNGDLIIPEIQLNKRGKNFSEFAGIILGFTKNSQLSINFNPSIVLPIIVNIWSGKKHIIIDETNQKIIYSNYFSKSELNFRYVHISETTTLIAKEILTRSRCSLPTLESSFNIHKELFRVFNRHISNVTGKTNQICPIT